MDNHILLKITMAQQTLSKGEEYVEVITRSVAREEGTEPVDLPPLVRTIDTDALENLLENSGPELRTVKFTYCGYTVTVGSDGSVDVREQS